MMVFISNGVSFGLRQASLRDVRAAVYEAANVILTHSVRGSDLKTWALA